MFLWMLLLVGAALADCLEGLEEVEEKYSAPTYYNHFRLAEKYESVAQCFSKEGSTLKAKEYFNRAGSYYIKAADNLTTDFGIKAALYNDAGDAYYSAGSFELALRTYEKSAEIAEKYPGKVEPDEIKHALAKISELTAPAGEKFRSPEIPKEEYQTVLWALLFAFLIGLFLLFLHERR